LSEETIATINAWLLKGKEYEEQPTCVVVPKREEVPKAVELEFLQKENYALRQQVSSLQLSLEDLQRQLTSSSYRVTELEQLLAREQFSNSQAQDALSNASLRISILNDEITSLTSNWERERANIVNDLISSVKDKEREVMEISLERDNLKDKLAKCTVWCIYQLPPSLLFGITSLSSFRTKKINFDCNMNTWRNS